MKKNTFKDYKLAIKEQYALTKTEDVSGILDNPTPAQMRTFCLLLFDKGMNRHDEDVFRIFFEPKEGEALKRAIDRINIAKFKTIISFLKGDKDMDNPIRIEIAAILVNLKERPYKVFAKSDNDGILPEDFRESEKFAETLTINQTKKENDKQSSFLLNIGKNKFITIFLIITSLFVGFSLSKFVFPEKQCMQWQEDHYEVVDCEHSNQNTSENSILPLDKKLLDFRKVEVYDTTVFFTKQGKPLYWYCKVNGKPEFFNEVGNGSHPTSGNAIKPVTNYIVLKYVLKK
jgi:hypothetical protein